MTDTLLPLPTKETARLRASLVPETDKAWRAFSAQAFAEGALTAKTKELIAVAVAHTTQCPYCIRGHVKAAVRCGATAQEVMEAIWVATEMRAGAAFAHSTIALAALESVGAIAAVEHEPADRS